MPASIPPSPPLPPAASAALRVEVVSRSALSPAHVDAVAAVCERAYEEDLRAALADFTDATHVLGFLGDAPAGDALVSHACWVPRTLGYGGPPPRWSGTSPASSGVIPLRTAYVELVATDPPHQGRGYASAVLRALAAAIAASPPGAYPGTYDVGALSPSDAAFYARLGWEVWRGPLFEAGPDGRVVPTDDEEIMVLGLPGARPLDLTQPLVAPWRPGDIW